MVLKQAMKENNKHMFVPRERTLHLLLYKNANILNYTCDKFQLLGQTIEQSVDAPSNHSFARTISDP